MIFTKIYSYSVQQYFRFEKMDLQKDLYMIK